ncbi:MAG: glycosyltransferase family 4 protein [candidate division NC10 bacterium]|nr:glycosyltransferase family 4 protein [candidate division NC10 bacterium]
MPSASSLDFGQYPDLLLRGPARVAFVTSTPLSVAEGSGTYVGISQLARSLQERNIRVQMVAPAWWSPSFTVKRMLFNILVAPRLRAGRCDWVLGFDLDGFHYGRRKTAPYIASIKGVIADELTNERGAVRAALCLQAALEKLAVQRADVVVATSRYSRERIVQAYAVPASRIVIVPELIDLRVWAATNPPPSEAQAGPPAVLTVAHMYPRKNLGVLLNAYALLRDASVPFQAWIVGEGPCRRAWERLRDDLGLTDRVSFLGSIPRRDLVYRYRRAAVFCLPSRQEGFGIVFLEAMACGKPVVAARAAAVPETVAEGETGLLVDPEDSQGLAHAIGGLLRDPGLRRAMGEAGRRTVERYRADRVAASFLATVHSALKGHPSAQRLTHTSPGVSLVAGGEPVGSASAGGGG